MRIYANYLAAVPLLFLAAQAQAGMVWSARPVENGAGNAHQHHQSQQHAHGQQRKAKRFYLHGGQGARVEFWLPSTEQRPLSLNDEDASVALHSTGMVSYHLLMATRQQPGRVETALRYHYMRGKPTDYSPATLVKAKKSQLELVPNPLPREHWRYQSLKPADFIVRFNGKPLTNKELRLTTSLGSSMKLSSDEHGRVRFLLPDDFTQVKPGRKNNPTAEFFVEVAHQESATDYHTSYSADYYVSPSHWQSTMAGFGAMLVGFVGGLAIIRRRKDKVQ